MVSELLASIIIAIVQGMTEWLPVSSSGHLVLTEKLLGFSGGLDFDVALHFGTLAAVFVYFGGDIVNIIREFFLGRWSEGDGRLGLYVIIATIPAAAIGFLMQEIFTSVFSNLTIVAASFAVSGMFLIVASVAPVRKKALTGWSALVIGVAQIFALFPGVSRSGSTFGAGVLLGLSEREALKFSFLMSIPIIFGANILVIGNNPLDSTFVWATLVSFIVGLITIHLLYDKILTNRKNLVWFGLYAMLLSIIILGTILL